MKCTAALLATLVLLVMGVVASGEQRDVPALVGEWEGTWGGNMTHPMKMTVADQRGEQVSGTVTFGGSSFPARGTIQFSDGKPILIIYITGFEFTVHQDKLAGHGYGPRHQGPAVLTKKK